MIHKIFVEVLLELLNSHLRVAGRVIHRIDVDFFCDVLYHLNQICKAVIDRAKFFEHHQQVGEEYYHFIC